MKENKKNQGAYEKRIFFGIFIFTAFVYVFFATGGSFVFQDLLGYYNLLADAFLQGHVHLLVDPQTMRLWDTSIYEGKYFLYFGPLPGLFHAAWRLIFQFFPSDSLATILFGLVNIIIFWKIITYLRKHYFGFLPLWVCSLFLISFALGSSNLPVSSRGWIYHEVIIAGSTFTLIALYSFMRFLREGKRAFIFLSGLFLAGAVACRVHLVVLYTPAFLCALLLHYLLWRREKVPLGDMLKSCFLFIFPIAFVVGGLLLYNYVRFDRWFEFGANYLVTWQTSQRFLNMQIKQPMVSWVYFVPNVMHYFFSAVHLRPEFPFIFHDGWSGAMSNFAVQQTSSLFLASPFLAFSLLFPRILKGNASLRKKDNKPVRIYGLLLGAMVILWCCFFLVRMTAAGRYTQEIVPELFLLAFLCFSFFIYPRYSRIKFLKGLCIFLCGVSVIMYLTMTIDVVFNVSREWSVDYMKAFNQQSTYRKYENFKQSIERFLRPILNREKREELWKSDERFVYSDGWLVRNGYTFLKSPCDNAVLEVVLQVPGAEFFRYPIIIGIKIDGTHIGELAVSRRTMKSEIPLPVKRDKIYKVQLLSDQTFIPAEIVCSQDRRSLSVRIVTFRFKKTF